jgi:UDP-galactopyranose mutase
VREYLIVGAGFAGSVCARRLAEKGFAVRVVEKRSHIGGNAFDTFDKHGIRIHPYGPHIFHTKSERVFDWLSQYTEWRPYEHRVRSLANGKLVPFPINRQTINQLFDLDLDEQAIEAWLELRREHRDQIQTSEDLVLSSVGKELCDLLFAGYTTKQWGRPLSALKAAVAARIPVRFNDDDRYFDDQFQFMPAHGYERLFTNLLDHPKIRVELNTDYFASPALRKYRPVIYTGRVDLFFDECFGTLPYRSLEFKHQHITNLTRYQEVGTVNYPGDQPFTRITEFKHLTGQEHSGTSICIEYPTDVGDPYYPVPTKASDDLFARYDSLIAREKGAIFVGRLAQYRYYNMDQVIAAALKITERICA